MASKSSLHRMSCFDSCDTTKTEPSYQKSSLTNWNRYMSPLVTGISSDEMRILKDSIAKAIHQEAAEKANKGLNDLHKRGVKISKEVQAFVTQVEGSWLDDSSPAEIAQAQAEEVVHCLHCTSWSELVTEEDRPEFRFSEHLKQAGGTTCCGWDCKLGEVLVGCPACGDILMASVSQEHSNHGPVSMLSVRVPLHNSPEDESKYCPGSNVHVTPMGR